MGREPKGAQRKRATHPRACDFSKQFSKDWKRLSATGRYDMNRLKAAMLILVGNDAPLGPEYKDHPLKGDWASYRECHIGGDFLLIYKVDDKTGPVGSIVFVRTGSHSELFNE